MWITSYAALGLLFSMKAGAQPYFAEPNVTRANWMSPPANRWAFKNMPNLHKVTVMTRGSKADEAKLPYTSKDYDIENIKYIARDNPVANESGAFFEPVERTMAEMLNRSYTDGIVVMYKGKIIYENYFDGQDENTRHIMMSCTKSYGGLMTAMLAHEGLIDPEAMVTDYIPAMNNSALADATVRELMDMSTDYQYREVYADLTSEVNQHMFAMSMRDPPADYTGPTNVRDFLINLQKVSNETHGEKFTYRSANTDVLGWLINKVLGGNDGSAKYFTEMLWSKLGQEHDALILVDETHFPVWAAGSMVTARDAARFAEMMRNGGKNAYGEQLVAEEIVKDIMAGGSELNVEQFSKSVEGGPKMAMEGWAYRNQWWVKPDHIFAQTGIYGQLIWVDTKADLVIAKQSSFLTATDWIIDDEVLQAFYALGEHFQALSELGEEPPVAENGDDHDSDTPGAANDGTTSASPPGILTKTIVPSALALLVSAVAAQLVG